MQIGRAKQRNVANVLHNQQVQTSPHSVDSALQTITNGQLALRGLGGETAIPLPDGLGRAK